MSFTDSWCFFILIGKVKLKDLVTELRKVTNWFLMGVYMGVPDWELMAIRSDYQDTDDRKTHMLMKWMKLTSDLTWSAVVRALVGIKMRSLAEKVALKYGEFSYTAYMTFQTIEDALFLRCDGPPCGREVSPTRHCIC